MNKYFPVDPGFDSISALSILTRQGHHVALNWSTKETFPKKEGKGAAKGVFLIIGLALMDKETFYRFRCDVPLTERFKSDAWFANLGMGSTTELNAILQMGAVKPSEEDKKKAEELSMYSLF